MLSAQAAEAVATIASLFVLIGLCLFVQAMLLRRQPSSPYNQSPVLKSGNVAYAVLSLGMSGVLYALPTLVMPDPSRGWVPGTTAAAVIISTACAIAFTFRAGGVAFTADIQR